MNNTDTTTPRPRLVGYVRVSTGEQVEQGVSLDAQRARIEAYAACEGGELVAIYTDEGLSAKNTDRPALQDALSALRAGRADGLVTVKLDRLSRRTADVLDLADRSSREGWSLHSITEKLDTTSAAGMFVLTILGALAEMERRQVSERTTAALRHIRATGRKCGGHTPFGWDVLEDGRTLIENQAEQTAIEIAHGLRAAGASLTAIARHLTAKGIRTKLGKVRWFPQQVKNILAAPVG